jgi:DNA replication licensing factor MCM2
MTDRNPGSPVPEDEEMPNVDQGRANGVTVNGVPIDALEEDILGDQQRGDDEEEDGEDLFGDDMERDYEARPELDNYDPAMLADENEDQAPLTPGQRRAADQAMERRDRRERKAAGRLGAEAFDSSEEEAATGTPGSLDGQKTPQQGRRKRRRVDRASPSIDTPGPDYDDEDAPVPDLDRDTINKDEDVEPRLQDKIRQNFQQFLLNFRDGDDERKYKELMQKMVESYQMHLDVDYRDIQAWSPSLAGWVCEYPSKILPLLNETVMKLAERKFGTYKSVAETDEREIRVAIHSFLLTELIREMSVNHLNKLICVQGVVTKRSQVNTQLKRLYLKCGSCGLSSGPFDVIEDKDIRPGACVDCQRKGPWTVDKERTLYRNHQRIILQESPGKVEPGKMPRSKEVILSGDMVDTVRPGDELTLTGNYRILYDLMSNARHCFPVFKTQIDGVHLRRKGDLMLMQITDEETKKIRELARSPNARERIINSIAPSIYGMTDVKTGIAMAMFGGMPKVAAGRHRIRGDINVLVVGDPGLAKSQFLKYIEQTSQRAVYTSGKGASAVGLTAAVNRDEHGEFCLEGGAMVLADNGLCLIDEFDKMNDQDRTSIHEAMEQQSISISKAGIVATLQARCSVIAVANPLDGCYDPSLPFNKNVDLSDPILSRFDVLFVLRDEADTAQDERLADHVVCSHIRSHPTATPEEANTKPKFTQSMYSDPVDQELLKKYIHFARENIQPRFAEVDKEKLTQFYADIRQEAFRSGGAPMTVRHIDGMIRLAEANAKMELRNHVLSKDVDHAIALMLESFIQSQKHSVAEELRAKFSRYIKSPSTESDIAHSAIHRIFHEKEQAERLRKPAQDAEDEIQEDTFIDLKEEVGKELERLGISTEDTQDYLRSKRFKVDFRIEGNKVYRTGAGL